MALHEVRGTFYSTNVVGQMPNARGTSQEVPFIAKVHLTSELAEDLITRPNFSSVSPHPFVEKVSQWIRRAK